MKKLQAKRINLEIRLANSIRRVKDALNIKRGSGVLEVVLFSAIIILAIIAIRPEIVSVFTDTATSFRTWVASKLTQLFN